MKTHLPCDSCGSKDALTDYGDHTYCFSCGKHTGDSQDIEPSGNLLTGLRFIALGQRNISAETCQKFNYGVTNGLQVAQYFSNDGAQVIYQKTRSPDKNFKVLKTEEPPINLKSLLYGRQVWGDNGGRYLVITEGEIDCLSIHEAIGSLGFHSVSVPCGAQGALDSIRANLDWIQRYTTVYLCFDNDEPGKQAAAVTCQFLGNPTKYMTMNIPEGIKDANELWVQRGRAAVLEAAETARSWKPSGILDVRDFRRLLLEKPTRGAPWPWDKLNEITYGIRPGLILMAAGSGVGKTTWFKQVEAHCYSLGQKIGVIHLEEPAANTINGLLTLLTGLPFHTPDARIPDDVREKAVDELITNNRLVLFDKSIGFDEDIILGTISYMVQGLGCQTIFLDHLTAITDQYDREVNQRTRNLIVKIGKLVTTLEFPLFAISHLRKSDGKPHEEGGRVHLDDLLGAGAIKQWAEHVFALERNNQDEDPQARNRPMLRDLKNRTLGEFTGTVVPLLYDPVSYVLKEVDGFDPVTPGLNAGPSDF